MESFKQKHINLSKFLFIYKEKAISNTAFMGKALNSGVIYANIILLIFNTIKLVICFNPFNFLFFTQNLFPSILLLLGSISSLLSVANLDLSYSFWGYMLCAFGTLTLMLTSGIAMLIGFIAPGAFVKYIYLYLLLTAANISVMGYMTWVNYCYAKHLYEGNIEIIKTGKGERLVKGVEKELEVSGVPNVQTNASELIINQP
jgi:hypothetical protein